MLKKLFAAALLLAFTATANATPILPGIDGQFDINSGGTVTVDVTGAITNVIFDYFILSGTNDDDFKDVWTPGTNTAVLTSSLAMNSVANNTLFTIGGFSFELTSVRSNVGVEANGYITNNLYLLGMFSHDLYTSTEAQFFVSFQGLEVGVNGNKGFSATVTSPAPPAPPVEVSAPGTLALFGLALIGFAASRRQKKSI